MKPRKTLEKILGGSKNIPGRGVQPEVGGRRAVKDYHINIFYRDEDGGYIADIPDLKACSAFGATAEEALREVELAKRAWLVQGATMARASSRRAAS